MSDCASSWALIIISLLLNVVLVAVVSLYWWRQHSKSYGSGMQLEQDLEAGHFDKNVEAVERPKAPPTSPGCPRGDDLTSATAVPTPTRSSRRSGRTLPKPALTASALMGSPKASGSRQSSSMDEIDSMLQAAENEAGGSSNGDVVAPQEPYAKGTVKMEFNLHVEKTEQQNEKPPQRNGIDGQWDSDDEDWNIGHDARAEARRTSTERGQHTAFTASEVATVVDDSVSARVFDAVSRKPRMQTIATSVDASQEISSLPRRASLRRSRGNIPGRQTDGPALVDRAKAQQRRSSRDKLLEGAMDQRTAPRTHPRQAPHRDGHNAPECDVSLMEDSAGLDAAPRVSQQRRQAPNKDSRALPQRDTSLIDDSVSSEPAPRAALQKPAAQRKSVRIQSSEEENVGRLELAPLGETGDFDAMLNGMPGVSTMHDGEGRPAANPENARIQSSGRDQLGRSALSSFGTSADLEAMLKGIPGASQKPIAAELREFDTLQASSSEQPGESFRRSSARAFAETSADLDEEDPLAAALEARKRMRGLLQGVSGNMPSSMASKVENDSAVLQQSPLRLGSSSNSLPPPARFRTRLAAEEASIQAQEAAEDAWRRSFASRDQAELESDRSLPPKGLNGITDIVNMSSFSTPSDLREARKHRRNSNTSNTSIPNRASGGRPLDHKAKNLQLDSSSNEVEPETYRPGRSRQKAQSNFNSQRSAEKMPADENNEWSQVVHKSQGGAVQWY